MKSSIRTKIMVVYSVLLLTVLVCQLVFGIFLSRRFVLYRTEGMMEKLFATLSEGYSDEPDTIFALTGTAENNYRINITISDGEKLIYANRQSNNAFFNHPPKSETFSGTEKQPAKDITPDIPAIPSQQNESFYENFSETPEVMRLNPDGDSNGNEMLMLEGKFTYNGSPRYITFWVTVESVNAVVGMFTQISTLIAAAVLVVGLLVAFLIARGLTKPIKDIETVSERIADLDFSRKADETAKAKELAGLACSVNVMADRLQQAFDDMRLVNARLEQDINNERRLEKMRREFIANVSHEMKTPLCLLQMYCENLKDDVEGIDREYYYQTIIDETARLDEMVRQMLDISSVENGLETLQTEPLDFSRLVRYTVSKLEIMAEEIELTVEAADDVWVTGNARYLEQAIKNYVTNAATHTPSGGALTVTLTAENDCAVLWVYNDGQRIDPKKMPYIWDSFYKTDEARTRVEGVHAGLGLYIVKIIAERHGGSYGAENRENGVAFFLSLPMVTR